MNDQLQLSVQILEKMGKIETMLADLIRQHKVQEWYTTDEVAAILCKAKFTVREWCRQGRVHGQKKNNGRGQHRSWTISHDELLRIQREGLLPLKKVSTLIN